VTGIGSRDDQLPASNCGTFTPEGLGFPLFGTAADNIARSALRSYDSFEHDLSEINSRP
jgi:hypothetical protein